MIQMGTKLKVVDNSGAQEVECIKVLNKTNRGYVGDIFVCSVKKVSSSNAKVKKGQVVKAVLVISKKPCARSDGTVIRFGMNGAVLLNNQGDLYGTRLLFPVDRRLKINYPKLISLAPEVL